MGKQIRFIMDEHDESIFFSYIIGNSTIFFKIEIEIQNP